MTICMGAICKDLVTTSLLALNRGVVHIPDMPFADVLRGELEGYSQRITAAGTSIFESGDRDSPHDDLVFALMLGLYFKFGPVEDCGALDGSDRA